MPKHRRKRKPPKRSLALPDLEQSKSAVLNTLTSKRGQRTYDHVINEFVDWYCSEPRLAFNRTVAILYARLNRAPEALAEAVRAVELSGSSTRGKATLAMVSALLGKRGEARSIL